jgi:hypothetical protein
MVLGLKSTDPNSEAISAATSIVKSKIKHRGIPVKFLLIEMDPIS